MVTRLFFISVLHLTSFSANASGTADTDIPWSLITAQIVNFSLFALAIIFLLKKPASEYFTKFRTDFLEESSKAQMVVAAAEKQKKQIDDRLNTLETTYATKLEGSKKEAQILKENIVKETQERANRLIIDTKENANILFKTAEVAMRNRVLTMAVKSATNDLTKKIDNKESDRLHDEFLEEISAGLS